MKIILLSLLLSLTSGATQSSASFTVVGVIKPILTVKVHQVNPHLYNAVVTSNNPNGFKLSLDHDGTLNPQDQNPAISFQTTGGVYNFPLRFTTPPTFLNVSIFAD